MKNYSFTILLALSLILCAAAWSAGIIRNDHGQIILQIPFFAYNNSDIRISASNPAILGADAANTEYETTDNTVAETAASTASNTTFAETAPGTGFAQEPATIPEITTFEPSSTAPAPPTVPVMHTADSSYFDNALFIGDSRTVGLYEYGNLGNAEVIADSGMSVHKIFDRKFTTASKKKKSLEEVLRERQFGKVYIMLGINELGYDFDYTVSKYTELVNYVRRMQPDSIIFLEANLHITDDRTNMPPYCNNENINRFNNAVKQLADEQGLFYLDVNEIFDDSHGNLSKEYTVDNAHVLGKYYTTWVDWILMHAV